MLHCDESEVQSLAFVSAALLGKLGWSATSARSGTARWGCSQSKIRRMGSDLILKSQFTFSIFCRQVKEGLAFCSKDLILCQCCFSAKFVVLLVTTDTVTVTHC